MKKIFKLFIVSLLTLSLGVATVVCCCIAPSVMAHFHKTAMCGQKALVGLSSASQGLCHCHQDGSKGKSSIPLSTCQQQLTSADFLHSSTISSPIVSANPLPTSVFVNDHRMTLTHSLLLAYPPGGPPRGISFTPLYLRTFNLRV